MSKTVYATQVKGADWLKEPHINETYLLKTQKAAVWMKQQIQKKKAVMGEIEELKIKMARNWGFWKLFRLTIFLKCFSFVCL